MLCLFNTGVEAWTLTEASCISLEAFETYCYRCMLRIAWLYHIANETVLGRIRKETEIMKTIKERKLSYYEHITVSTSDKKIPYNSRFSPPENVFPDFIFINTNRAKI